VCELGLAPYIARLLFFMVHGGPQSGCRQANPSQVLGAASMKPSSILVVSLLLCATACGDGANETTSDERAVQARQGALSSSDSLIGTWAMGVDPQWKWRFDASGEAILVGTPPFHPYCWTIGAVACRNVVSTGPGAYEGEVNTCDRGFVPMTIALSGDTFTLSYDRELIQFVRLN
jgi:hypothetical protein